MKYLNILILFFSFTTIYAQFIIDAGRDTNLCDFYKPITLGGNPTAKGGVEPYTYLWELEYCGQENGFYYFAHNYLDDTTVSNPRLVNSLGNGKFIFHLTVHSSDNVIRKDSIIICNSSIILITLIPQSKTINLGDSVQLFAGNVIAGIPPFSYTWYPDYNLSSPYDASPYARPDTSTKYVVKVVDSIGCIAYDEFWVKISTVNIHHNKDEGLKMKVYPNPLNENSILEIINPWPEYYNIIIYDISGKKIASFYSNEQIIEINNYFRSSGLYYIYIHSSKESINPITIFKF